jgi:hypothetical protein
LYSSASERAVVLCHPAHIGQFRRLDGAGEACRGAGRFEPAGVQQCHVADRDARADHAVEVFLAAIRRFLAGHVDDRTVLDVGTGADADRRVVAANDAIEPDVGIRADLDIADHDRVRRDKGGRVDARQNIAIGQDQRSHGAAFP